MSRISRYVPAVVLAAIVGAAPARAQEPEPIDRPAASEGAKRSAAGDAIEKKLKLPGIKINVKERCLDVDSFVCLDQGTLELVACTKDTKEHESIVAIDARPMHIHTALLLLGAKSGSPAMRQQVGDGEQMRWVDVEPRGGAVDVSLVFEDKEGKTIERPISDFISRAPDEGDPKLEGKFPTSTFLFAGSHLQGDGPGPRKYLAGVSGNVISIATFGDELLCLPDLHGHENGSLLWQVDATHLPAVGSKVTLRLRPHQEPAAPKTKPDHK